MKETVGFKLIKNYRNKKTFTKENIPHLTPIDDPKASNCSEIWKASSL